MGVFVSQSNQSPGPTVVSAIHINNKQQNPAFNVVDAVDDLHGQLGALRAVAQLADSDRHGDEGLPQLRRSDLARLICVLNTDLMIRCDNLRAEALRIVASPTQGANPV